MILLFFFFSYPPTSRQIFYFLFFIFFGYYRSGQIDNQARSRHRVAGKLLSTYRIMSFLVGIVYHHCSASADEVS